MSAPCWSIHKSRVAADFGAAAASYNDHARLQRAVIGLLLDRLETPVTGTLLDLGCGTGLGLERLLTACPGADLVALDLAQGMLEHARSQLAQPGGGQIVRWVGGDAESLPLAPDSVDLVFSSLAVQWCEDLPAVLDELARVLKPDGRLLLSTLVAGTLDELTGAWAQADPGGSHVNRFLPEAMLRAEVSRAFPSAEVEVVPITLRYAELTHLLRELKALGARYKGSSPTGRVTGPGRMRKLAAAYSAMADSSGKLPATYQVALVRC